MAGGSRKVIIISLFANFGIAVSKLAGAFFTGSAALMAEAVHSFSDCGNQGLLLYGGAVAKKPPSVRYPLGRGKEMFFWSFVVALLLFTMGGMFSLYEGIHKLQHPEALHYPVVAIAILLVAIALESFSMWACYKEVQLQNTYGSLWQWIQRTSSADLLVIFLEDLAALLGLFIALAALSAAWITGNPFWDGLGSCVIGVLLLIVAVVLAREVKPMLIGERASTDYKKSLAPLATQHFSGGKLLTVLALQQGVGAVLLAYKLHPGDLSVSATVLMDKINAFEKAVRAQHPEIQWQFAEIDVES